MPIYAYICNECKHEVEKIQKINDPAPECEKSPEHGMMDKQLSAPKFRFQNPSGTDRGRLMK